MSVLNSRRANAAVAQFSRTSALALFGVALGLLIPRAKDAAFAEGSSEGVDFFEKKIRPVLVAECYECHGAKKAKGGLRLDSRAGWKQGGDSGEVINPGNPARSLLIRAIRHEDPELKMPGKAPKLDESIIADFEMWVKMGAPDPRDHPPAEQAGTPLWADTLQARRGWWSFQPVQKPAVPIPESAAWSPHPVDCFLLEKMEAHGLTPAPPADQPALLRRVTLALTGLPPTAEETAAFLADDSPEAFARMVDRLLASPRFGERWARHWMDLMRYAETHGSESDPNIPQAWRYRDYLIRAFNADVPCDQLIREHLAGDLLASPRIDAAGVHESILGTAQLRMVEHGFQPVDTLDDQVKAVDNQIDVVSKAFQALTISCSRCHDHKFDPISQRDYYALFGVFASCRPAQVTIDLPAVLQKNDAFLEALRGRIKAALTEAWAAAASKIGARLRHLPAAPAKDAARPWEQALQEARERREPAPCLGATRRDPRRGFPRRVGELRCAAARGTRGKQALQRGQLSNSVGSRGRRLREVVPPRDRPAGTSNRPGRVRGDARGRANPRRIVSCRRAYPPALRQAQRSAHLAAVQGGDRLH